jgi:ubiquinone/menaquinone biosynthesis C-methylase UbiE
MSMDEQKLVKIKEAVQRNFDASPDPYQAFEDKHGFFRNLNKALLAAMQLPSTACILDVGCGTGASCAQMLEDLPECRVWGLDLSAAMLETARSRVPESKRMCYLQGDAGKLAQYCHNPFDAVIYSASIFLIPDYRESLRQAVGLLTEGGYVGLTFMDGLYDPAGNNLFALADEQAQQGVSLKKPVKWADFQSFFQQAFPEHKSWNEDFIPSEELLREFFCIPAMSAGLFPGLAYPERVRKVGRLFDLMPETQKVFRWKLMIGKREGAGKEAGM